MKRNKLILGSCLVLALAIVAQVSHVQAVESEQLNNIAQNCSSIKQSLSQLQHADSRTRTYLGSAYEKISRDFIVPLNLRLSKNNRSVDELTKIEQQFFEAQANFRTYYTEYMRDLDGLIATDCQAHPQEFYDKLKLTREKRAKLQATTKQLSSLIDSQTQAVTKLQESL